MLSSPFEKQRPLLKDVSGALSKKTISLNLSTTAFFWDKAVRMNIRRRHAFEDLHKKCVIEQLRKKSTIVNSEIVDALKKEYGISFNNLTVGRFRRTKYLIQKNLAHLDPPK